MLISFPSQHYIRHVAQPGCTWPDDTELAVLPTRGLLALPNLQSRLLDGAGKLKTPSAQGSRNLNLTFMAFKRAEASSPGCRLTRTQSLNGSGNGSQEHFIVASATHLLFLFGAG